MRDSARVVQEERNMALAQQIQRQAATLAQIKEEQSRLNSLMKGVGGGGGGGGGGGMIKWGGGN